MFGRLRTFSLAIPPPLTEFCKVLSPSLAFSYIGSITALHLSSGHQPNFGVVKGMELRNIQSSFLFCAVVFEVEECCMAGPLRGCENLV